MIHLYLTCFLLPYPEYVLKWNSLALEICSNTQKASLQWKGMSNRCYQCYAIIQSLRTFIRHVTQTLDRVLFAVCYLPK